MSDLISKKIDYEYTEEDKKRRKIIPTKDYRLAGNWANRLERIYDFGVLKLRQGATDFINYNRSNVMTYGVIIFLLSVWLSGWFANANSDMRFESLLTLVLGVVVLITFSLKNERSK